MTGGSWIACRTTDEPADEPTIPGDHRPITYHLQPA
jgi:hypothetical protein